MIFPSLLFLNVFWRLLLGDKPVLLEQLSTGATSLWEDVSVWSAIWQNQADVGSIPSKQLK